jgi:hypothetical protein
MSRDREDEQEKLRLLNERFLQEIEKGKKWADLQDIVTDMKEIQKRLSINSTEYRHPPAE